MKKAFVFFAIVVMMVASAVQDVKAQVVPSVPNNGAFVRSDIQSRKPTALPYIREADVMWSKKIWRIIDLREKINQPLYYPTENMEGKYSLISLLLKGIQENKITAYDDEFKTPMEYEQVKNNFGATTRTRKVRNVDTGNMEDQKVEGAVHPEEIMQIMVKEEWYFDKQTSTMNVRILGLCPIREYYRDEDESQQDVQRTQVFWVYFPEARNLLATNEVFNPQNGARNLSFDDVFIKRKFNSYIVKEENVYNNRPISAYLSSKDAMLESQRIENSIFDYEQNLWEY